MPWVSVDFNITVDVAHAGAYAADVLYTSNRVGTISVDVPTRAQLWNSLLSVAGYSSSGSNRVRKH
jgi:hypothetical protein